MPKIPKSSIPIFSPGQLEAICKVLGDTDSGLTGTEIGHHLAQARIRDTDPGITKRVRLYNALAARHNADGNGNGVLQFIRYAMEPARYVGKREVFEARREGVNVALLLAGVELREDGKFQKASRAVTLSEAEGRASRLRKQFQDRNVHQEVLAHCRAELVAVNYFHAVLEASKSISDKLRRISGLDGDGAQLFTAALGGPSPVVAINPLTTESERGEQRGFVNLLTGIFGMFRNPTAHVPQLAE